MAPKILAFWCVYLLVIQSSTDLDARLEREFLVIIKVFVQEDFPW